MWVTVVAMVVVTTAAKRAPVRTAELATLPPAQASQGPDKPTATTRGLHLSPRGHRGAEGRCSRCGRRHILYKQQQEQVQQTLARKGRSFAGNGKWSPAAPYTALILPFIPPLTPVHPSAQWLPLASS